jgi:hypothetical protein
LNATHYTPSPYFEVKNLRGQISFYRRMEMFSELCGRMVTLPQVKICPFSSTKLNKPLQAFPTASKINSLKSSTTHSCHPESFRPTGGLMTRVSNAD